MCIRDSYSELTSGADQTAALASGSIQILNAVGGTSVILAAANGADIKIISMYSTSPGAFQLYSADPEINSPEDLKGKTIAGPKGTNQMCIRDSSFTPEIAQAMMRQEMENKKTTVWTLGNTLKCRDFWLITIPMGTLLMCSVGMMTQTQSIISSHPELNFGMVMAGIMVMSCFGSWLLGVLDTKSVSYTHLDVYKRQPIRPAYGRIYKLPISQGNREMIRWQRNDWNPN